MSAALPLTHGESDMVLRLLACTSLTAGGAKLDFSRYPLPLGVFALERALKAGTTARFIHPATGDVYVAARSPRDPSITHAASVAANARFKAIVTADTHIAHDRFTLVLDRGAPEKFMRQAPRTLGWDDLKAQRRDPLPLWDDPEVLRDVTQHLIRTYPHVYGSYVWAAGIYEDCRAAYGLWTAKRGPERA